MSACSTLIVLYERLIPSFTIRASFKLANEIRIIRVNVGCVSRILQKPVKRRRQIRKIFPSKYYSNSVCFDESCGRNALIDDGKYRQSARNIFQYLDRERGQVWICF